MKKLILILILSVTTFVCNAQLITFDGELESGYEDRVIKHGYYQEYINIFENSLYSNIALKATAKFVNVYTTIKTYYKPVNVINYDPLQTEFKTGFSLNYKQISLGYEHFCSHSIDKFRFSDAYDRVSIKIKLF